MINDVGCLMASSSKSSISLAVLIVLSLEKTRVALDLTQKASVCWHDN